ncbi:MAG: M23 family metallopeptidase [Acidobacteria bacterium]|nr:M23 family metallopeptidase [Acidobacteriota bacterium]
MKIESKFGGATFAAIFFLLLLAFSFPALAQTPPVSWSPDKLINGAPCVFRYKPVTRLKSLTGSFLGKQVFFAFDKTNGIWYGLAGVDYDTKPGSYDLALNGVEASGKKLSFAQIVPIAKGFYRTSALSVPKKYVEPDPADVARILQERDLKNELFGKVTSSQLWMGNFLTPAATNTSSEFGSQRTYNGKRQSVHQGLDYRASTGTAIHAINSGKVILARELYFEGNCIVIDHGQGLLSLYLHLSQFKVKEGDTVNKSQLIALSGGTGRVTGPHLHLAVRWQGSYVNPATLLGIKLP